MAHVATATAGGELTRPLTAPRLAAIRRWLGWRRRWRSPPRAQGSTGDEDAIQELASGAGLCDSPDDGHCGAGIAFEMEGNSAASIAAAIPARQVRVCPALFGGAAFCLHGSERCTRAGRQCRGRASPRLDGNGWPRRWVRSFARHRKLCCRAADEVICVGIRIFRVQVAAVRCCLRNEEREVVHVSIVTVKSALGPVVRVAPCALSTGSSEGGEDERAHEHHSRCSHAVTACRRRHTGQDRKEVQPGGDC